MKVFLAELKEIHPKAIKLLKTNGLEVVYDKKNKDIEVVFIRTYTRVDKFFLNNFPNLKYILKAGVGLDNIDLEECQKRNIKVINAPGSNANSVAEFVIALMIMVLRNFPLQVNLLLSGKWRNLREKGFEIKDKVIGLIGCGAIGKLIAKKLKSFEVKKILGYDPYLDEKILKSYGIKKTDFLSLLKNSDIVSLHLPLTEETKNLIGKKELKMMKKNSYLINTSRGGIINESDLIWALKNNIIKGAALDVFEGEPKIKKEFLSLKNVILTPHIAALTEEADEVMSVEPVKKFLDMIK